LNWNDLAFESDRHIANINVAILILHAEDDAVIPIHLAKKVTELEILKIVFEKWCQFPFFVESCIMLH
jgi:hypothetical protein